MLRNSLSLEEAEKRISAQMSQEEKKKFADYLIDTSEGFDDTRRQTEAVYAALRRDLNLEETRSSESSL
jgi:dephospho-CoA kinase